MSYSANMRDARDDRLPLRHRISHLRSCANHMAQKYRVPRSVVLELINIKAKYATNELPSPEVLLQAASMLDQIKRDGLLRGA
jgi:hypothetical protein